MWLSILDRVLLRPKHLLLRAYVPNYSVWFNAMLGTENLHNKNELRGYRFQIRLYNKQRLL